MAKRRPQFQSEVVNFRDLTPEAESVAEQHEPPHSNNVPAQKNHTRRWLESIVDPDADLVAKYSPGTKIRERGPSNSEAKYLVQEYGNRDLMGKAKLLEKIQMTAKDMAGYFHLPLTIPVLPTADPVFVHSARSREEAVARLEKVKELPLSEVTVSRTYLWERARTALENGGIYTLGDLSKTDPAVVADLDSVGEKQLMLIGEILETYKLLTLSWKIYLKMLQVPRRLRAKVLS